MPAFRIVTAAAALAVGVAFSAGAFPLVPTSYDMRNGNGVASGGSFNYWDIGYSGVGSISGPGAKTADGETLTGGLGDLTDGVIAPGNWFVLESVAGTGPYVGWCRLCGSASTANPSVTFRFTPGALETYVFDSVTLYLDDSNGSGGVRPPLSVSVSVDGGPPVVEPVFDPADGAPFSLTIPLAGGAAGTTIDLILAHDDQWIFLSEVTFEGRIIIRDDFDVPAPAPLGLFGLALAGIAVLRRNAAS